MMLLSLKRSAVLLFLVIGGTFLPWSLYALSCHPLYFDARSSGAAMLNDAFAPGLPHIAILKKRNNFLFTGRYAKGKQVQIDKRTGGNDLNNGEIVGSEAGFDWNYTPNWLWGFNVNALVKNYQRDASQSYTGEKMSDYKLIASFAGHYNWSFFYGFGVGKSNCTHDFDQNNRFQQSANIVSGTTGESSEEKKLYDFIPIQLGVGARLQWFFVGLGAEYIMGSIKRDVGDESEKNNYSNTLLKAGIGWNSGGFRAGQFQLNYTYTMSPEQSAVTDFIGRQASRHDISAEMQYIAFQAGLYYTLWNFTNKYPGFKKSEYEVLASLGYLPWEGSIFSLQVFMRQATEQYLEVIGDDSYPENAENVNMIALNFGSSFY